MNLYTTKKSGIHNVLLVMDRSGDQVTDTKTQHLGIGNTRSCQVPPIVEAANNYSNRDRTHVLSFYHSKIRIIR